MKVQELFEKKYESSRMDVNEAVSLLNAHCADALWMLHENKPIWRGDAALNGAIRLADPSTGIRISANTQNYYTLIFDNHPAMKDWPKRSRSFIASYADSTYAAGYGKLYALIPFDGVKIGCVNERDMFDINIPLFYPEGFAISHINNIFEMWGFSDNDWTSFLEDVKQFSPSQITDYFRKVYQDISIPDNLATAIEKAYSPKSTGFKLRTSKTLRNIKPCEVWVGGKCILIQKSMWDGMVKSARDAGHLDK